ncbi:ATP synthase subunit I [Radiobacillus kanasensis]|uniref:ATP synthase subunit I n=1 Tax=Radiobacillus kanasensis TaxID=2844358 RepID=UPI001E568F83|nr:ATP synthase subunit I [Radiobacillus kanasensis]UFT98951.1 ATP synthase subunit I [Radiobacillus kanasensis]
MNQYDSMITRQRKWMFYLLSLLVVGAGFTPYPRIFLGLLLGTVISFYNLWLMQRKINQLGLATIQNRQMRGIGTFTRLASGAAAALIALRFEEYFHLIAVIIGLMTAYVVIMIDFALLKSRDLHKEEG